MRRLFPFSLCLSLIGVGNNILLSSEMRDWIPFEANASEAAAKFAAVYDVAFAVNRKYNVPNDPLRFTIRVRNKTAETRFVRNPLSTLIVSFVDGKGFPIRVPRGTTPIVSQAEPYAIPSPITFLRGKCGQVTYKVQEAAFEIPSDEELELEVVTWDEISEILLATLDGEKSGEVSIKMGMVLIDAEESNMAEVLMTEKELIRIPKAD